MAEKEKKEKGGLNIDLKDLDVKSLRPLLVPLLGLIILILLFVLAGRFLYSRITAQREALQQGEKTAQVLVEKQRVLSSFSTVIGGNTLEVLNSSLPEKGVSLIMLSQLKRLVASHGISLTNLNINPTGALEDVAKRVEVQFDVDGNLPAILVFIEDLETVAPISRLEKVEFTSNLGLTRASVTLSVFEADFPTNIPAIDEPVRDLTNEEVSFLGELATFLQPVFVGLPPSEPVDNPNPFN